MGGNKIHFTLDYGIGLHPDCNWIWHTNVPYNDTLHQLGC